MSRRRRSRQDLPNLLCEGRVRPAGLRPTACQLARGIGGARLRRVHGRAGQCPHPTHLRQAVGRFVPTRRSLSGRYQIQLWLCSYSRGSGGRLGPPCLRRPPCLGWTAEAGITRQSDTAINHEQPVWEPGPCAVGGAWPGREQTREDSSMLTSVPEGRAARATRCREPLTPGSKPDFGEWPFVFLTL